MVSSVGDRLKQARIEAGYPSAAAAAEAFGWHKQNVSDHEAERRGMSPDQAKAYADAYRVNPSWLLWGGSNPKRSAEIMVPIRGKVGADPSGVVLYSDGQESGDLVPVPPGSSARATALRVVGHSMPDVADEGSLIYFEDQHIQPTPDMIGRIVVAELDTGEVVVKRLLRGEERGLWDLESIAAPPRRNVRIRWVAEITYIVLPNKARRIIRRAVA